MPLIALARRLAAGVGRAAAGARRHRGWTLAVLSLLALGPVAGAAAWTWRAAGAVDLSGVRQDATVLYATGQTVVPGLSVDTADLAGTLRRLGYQEVRERPSAPGQFRRDATSWEIFLRPRNDPRATRPALAIGLTVDGGRVGAIRTGDGGAVGEIELEPEVLAGLGDGAGQLRQPVPLTTVPPHLVSAVLAAEDRRFFQHHGIDTWAVARAVWVNLRRGEVRQGASTLTQQLVKNVVLTPQRTWGRKVREAALALAVERRHGKREILEAYLNGIYLGQQGPFAIHGVGAAARAYFGKDVDRLTLGESALLAGIIRAPNTYSPAHHPDRARERRNRVLRVMRELGAIDDSRLAQATREKVVARAGGPTRLAGAYFADYVRVQVEGLQSDGEPPAGGLRIYTTLDPLLQRVAEAAVARGLDRLESQWPGLRRRDVGQQLQAALLALDPATGEIRAMVGGRDYTQSQFNRATQARRQPGSAFKPFVYLAALSFGPRGEPPHFTPVSRLEDRPLTIRHGKDTWSPRNYENRYEGTVTVRRAIEQSLNAATVWMAEGVGLEAVVRAARDAGLRGPLASVPALSLGSFEVTPIELAAAYAPFANGGQRVAPTGLRALVDQDGGVAEPPRPASSPAMRPDEAYLVTSLLTGVIDRGTGAGARLLGVEGPVAGKTGTTNEGRDAWFVGYTPRLVALVWVGFDQKDVLRLSGAQAALPIWADFMRTAMAIGPREAFTPPPSIVFRDVDPSNGKLAGRWCPVIIREAFLQSTEPRETCPDHGPVDTFRSFFQRLFESFR